MRPPKNFVSGPEALAQFAKEHSFFTVSNDGIELIDPTTGKPLNPHAPPVTVFTEPSTRIGLGYVSELGLHNKLSITTILSPQRSARDFASMILDSGGHLDNSSVVAVNARSRAICRPYSPASIVLERNSAHASFQRAQNNWLGDTGKNILPCEPAQLPPCNELRLALGRLTKQFQTVSELNYETHGYEGPTMLKNAIRLSYDTLQQWSFIGKLGFLLLEEYEASGIQTANIPYILDWRHESIASRLTSLGVSVDTHLATRYTGQTHSDSLFRMVYTDMLRDGKATFTQLKMPLVS